MNFFKKFLDYAKFATGDFEELFSGIEMPPCPKVVATLLKKLNEPDIDIEQIVPILESDASLAAQILKIANSALYGLPGKVTSISKAVSLLGLKEIKNIAVGYAMTKTIKDPCRKGFDIERYWSDTIFRAVFSKKVADFIGVEADEAFSASLLQDIAIPMLMERWFHLYKGVFEKWLQSDEPLHEIEDKILAWNHAQAGAWISKSWQLPDIFTCCIGLHISTIKDVERLGLEKTVVAPVTLSNKISLSFQERKPAEKAVEEAKALGIDEDALEDLIEDSKEMVSSLAEALGIRAS
ncbi:MAG: HDOD domain-containing protein [Thermodesulfobacteria bacterium]|nr:HDOD domain-containing protein [Thermodesulfobacteriota bacterium]